jgi:drug/metabolite transporter (DMT)-like permease
MDEVLIGILAAMIATISWSLAPITIKLGIKSDIDLIALTGVRGLVAFILLIPFCIPNILTYNLSYYDVILILISSILIGISDLFYIEAIKRLGSWKAILIAYQYILIAQILAYLLLNEVRGIYAVFFTPIALLGIYIALSGGESLTTKDKINFLIAYTPAIFWGVATVISKYLTSTVDAVLIATLRASFIALIFMSLGIRRMGGFSNLSRFGLLSLLASGFFTHVGGFLTFLYALKFVGTFISTLINSIGPLITQFLASRLSKEGLSPRHIVGALVTTSSIMLALMLNMFNIV